MCTTPYYCKIKKTGGEGMNKKRDVLKFVETVARIKVEADSHRWPPLCTGILHQPKRPIPRNKDKK